MAYAFQPTPATFQGNGFQVAQVLAAAAALGTNGSTAATTIRQTGRKSASAGTQAGKTATATRVRRAAGSIGGTGSVASPGRIITPALTTGTFGSVLSITGPGPTALKAAASLSQPHVGLQASSPKIGVGRIGVPFGHVIGLSAPTVRAAKKSSSALASGEAVAALIRRAGFAVGHAGTTAAVRDIVGISFEPDAFQGHAFQTGYGVSQISPQAGTAVLGAKLQVAPTNRAREYTGIRPAFGSGFQPNGFESYASPAILGARGGATGLGKLATSIAMSIAAKVSATWSPRTTTRQAITFGVSDGFVYYQILTGHATLPIRVGLAPTSVIPLSFDVGFQSVGFQQSLSLVPTIKAKVSRPPTFGDAFQRNAFEDGSSPVVMAAIPAAAVFGRVVGRGSTLLATRKRASGFGLRIVHAAGSIGGASHGFLFRSSKQIFVGFGTLGAAKGGIATSARYAGKGRATVGGAGLQVSGSGRLAVALARILAAKGGLTGRGQRATAAAAQALAARTSAAVPATRTIQRPSANPTVAAGVAVGPVRAVARSLGALAERASLSASPRLALRIARAMAIAGVLLGRGNRTTSDTAAFGARETFRGNGLTTAYGAATLSGPVLGQSVGPVRVNARPIGQIRANARIPATTTSQAAVATQRLTAKLATPSAIRMGRFAAATVMRAAFRLAGRFNPQIAHHGKGVTLKNDHERLRELLRGAPRVRGLRNARRRIRDLP